MDRVVSFQSVGIAFGNDPPTEIVRAVSLDVVRGEFLVVFGTSGVGKSTLLRAACGLVNPSSGRVERLIETPAGCRPFGFVFQEPRLFPWRRVDANVALGLEGLGIPAAERSERVHAALRLVGLAHLAHRFPRQLSGGQRQRVGIARALAVRPSVLLMDEPFSALDAITRRTLGSELLAIWKATGTSIVFVTHDVDEAISLADRIVLLAGTPATVVEEYRVATDRPRNPDDPAVRALAGRLRSDLHAYQANPVI